MSEDLTAEWAGSGVSTHAVADEFRVEWVEDIDVEVFEVTRGEVWEDDGDDDLVALLQTHSCFVRLQQSPVTWHCENTEHQGSNIY